MKYCNTCGSKTDPDSKFCGACGTKLEQPAKDDSGYHSTQNINQNSSNQTSQNPSYQTGPTYQGNQPNQGYYQPPAQSFTNTYGTGTIQTTSTWPVKRSYFNWFFLQFIPGLSYVYIFLNFDEMKKLVNKAHPSYSYKIQDPVVMLILLFVFSPISYYFKYQNLHEYTTMQGFTKDQGYRIPRTGMEVNVWFFGGLFAVFIIGIITGGIGFILIFVWAGFLISFENDWQEALNQQINYHSSKQI
jgi:hypothetical protein